MNIDEAATLYKSKAYVEAAEILDKLILSNPKIEQNYRLRGLAAIRLGRFNEARLYLEQAGSIDDNKSLVKPWLSADELKEFLVAEPNFVWAKYHLAFSYFEGRRFSDALGICQEVNSESGVSRAIRSGILELQTEISRRKPKAQAKTNLETFLSLAGDDVYPASAGIAQGLLAHSERDTSRAAIAFRLLAQDATGIHNRLPVTLGATTYNLSIEKTEFCNPALNFDGEIHSLKDKDRFILVCACDGRYFELFIETYISSALHLCGDIIIHVHVMNPSSQFINIRERLTKYVPWARLNFSIDSVDYVLPKPYYAAARYLIAYELLAKYNKPILITDVDAVIRKDIGIAIQSLSGSVGVKRNATDCLEYPWTEILAGYTYVRPDEVGFLFLQAISEFFWSNFDKTGKANSWWIDQNALLYAVSKYKKNNLSIFDITDTPLNKPIETNQSMEAKEIFIARVKGDYPLSALTSGPIGRNPGKFSAV